LLELNQEVEGEPYGYKGLVKKQRLVQRALVDKAIAGDVAAIREINDRSDGKVPQAIVGDDEHDPVRFGEVTDAQRAKALMALMARAKHLNGNGAEALD